MKTPPEHDRATLYADARSLRDCALRLEALTDGYPPPAGRGPDWTGVLAELAGRCRAAAAELEAAAALFTTETNDRPDAAAAAAAATTAAAAATATATAAVLGRVKRAAWPVRVEKSLANARRPLEP